jgi:DNA-binding CsgD family transcriptional regulator
MVERGTEMRLLAETPDGARVQFAHALVREAVYESVPAVRRRRIHRRVGETLVGRRHTDPDAVAYHFQQAGDERAYGWLLRAGGRAQDAHAWLTAAARFEAALAMAEERGIEERERAWLLMRLATMVALATPTRAVRIIEEAAHLAERAGDRGLAAYALLQRGTQMLQSSSDSQGLAFVEAGSAALEALTGDERTHLLSDAARYAIPNVVDDGRSSLVFHYGSHGRLAEALHIGESLLHLPEQVTVNLTYNGLAEAYDALGMPERSLAMRDQARAIALAWGHYTNVAYIETRILDLILQYDTDNRAGRHQAMDAAMAAGVLASGTRPAPPRLYGLSLLFLEGQWDEVQRVATSVRMIEEVSGFLLWRARLALLRLWPAIGEREATWGLIRELIPEGAAASPDSTHIRAAIHAQQAATQLALATGDPPTAKEWLEANDRWLAWSGSVLGQSEGQALWAQYYRQEGDTDKAREHAERALAHATEPRQPLALLAAHRLLGELDTDARRFDDAQSHLDISLALVDACAAPYERTLTLLALANLRAVQHETEAASTLLDEVTIICEPLGAKPTLALAAALRAHLTPTPAPAFPAGLSTREVQVLRLVAQGMTDRQVAELLFLSPRTINQHLRSIYNKLGVSSRAAATHFAVANGIA